jgi:hypothetical protein
LYTLLFGGRLPSVSGTSIHRSLNMLYETEIYPGCIAINSSKPFTFFLLQPKQFIEQKDI